MHRAISRAQPGKGRARVSAPALASRRPHEQRHGAVLDELLGRRVLERSREALAGDERRAFRSVVEKRHWFPRASVSGTSATADTRTTASRGSALAGAPCARDSSEGPVTDQRAASADE